MYSMYNQSVPRSAGVVRKATKNADWLSNVGEFLIEATPPPPRERCGKQLFPRTVILMHCFVVHCLKRISNYFMQFRQIPQSWSSTRPFVGTVDCCFCFRHIDNALSHLHYIRVLPLPTFICLLEIGHRRLEHPQHLHDAAPNHHKHEEGDEALAQGGIVLVFPRLPNGDVPALFDVLSELCVAVADGPWRRLLAKVSPKT